MGKNCTGNRPAAKLGKGRLTPIQIAYLVDRYLFDNNFSNTLSTFRSEASGLFSRTIDKKVPEGLLPLGNILDEYITLKEQKMNLEREKEKHQALVQGIQDSLLLYASNSAVGTPPFSSTPIPLPHSSSSILIPNPSPLSHHVYLPPPPGMLMPLPAPSSISKSPGDCADAVVSSPQGYTIQRVSLNKPVVSILPNDVQDPKSFSTPKSDDPSSNQKRSSEPHTLKIPPPKRSRAEPSYASTIKGITLPSQVNDISSIPVSTNNNCVHGRIESPFQGSSAQKNRFDQLPKFQDNLSSPKTRSPLSFSSQCDNFVSQQMIPSKCSVISSKKVTVINPYKKAGSYSGERSHHDCVSPLKSCSNKLGKRDHVKNRLDFECLEVAPSIENHISTSSNYEKTEDAFDVEFLTICRDLSFSQLHEFELDCQPSSSSSADFTQW